MPATMATINGALAPLASAGRDAPSRVAAVADLDWVARGGMSSGWVIVVMRFPPLSSGASDHPAPPGSRRR
jgi:hypothetical protein